MFIYLHANEVYGMRRVMCIIIIIDTRIGICTGWSRAKSPPGQTQKHLCCAVRDVIDVRIRMIRGTDK